MKYLSKVIFQLLYSYLCGYRLNLSFHQIKTHHIFKSNFVKFYSCHYFQPYGMRVASPFLGKRVLSSEHLWHVRITTYIVGNSKTIADVHS